MGTQIPHGAWATSVACREARLRGRQSEPGNMGDSAEEAGKDRVEMGVGDGASGGSSGKDLGTV